MLDDLEQPLRGGLRERARGLVEDQQPRGRGDGARDLDLLLELDAQLAHGAALVDADVEAVEDIARVGAQLASSRCVACARAAGGR